MSSSDPFKLLSDMEHRCLTSATGLPSTEKTDDDWVGVAFRIGEDKLIAPMDDVAEILELPEFTSVPGVKSWVVGVANVRGNLLPLMDLKGFLLGDDIKQRRKGRVIVIDYKGFNTGLIVEEVYGMKHFTTKNEVTDLPQVHPRVAPYVNRAFVLEHDFWPVFNFDQMTNNDKFANASL